MTFDRTFGAGLSRRNFLVGGAAAATLALPGCASFDYAGRGPGSAQPQVDSSLAYYREMYASRVDEGYVLPEIPVDKLDPRNLRQVVADPTGERPGTVVVDTANHFLYFVLEGGQALRYGVGLGREGFAWSGRAVIQWKRKWPTWTPPTEMIGRQPELEKYSAANGGMQPGLENPLGARALYIFQNNEDTLYRVHGSPEWWTIGKSVSSGCVRMINQDVMDLYDRVPNKTPIVVTSGLTVS